MLIQLLIIQVITFIALIFVLRMLFVRQLNVALARLKRLHEENLIREEQLKKELDEAKERKEFEIKKGKEEAVKIVNDARRSAENAGTDIQLKAKEQAQKMMEHSKGEMGKLENDLAAKYQEKAVDLSINLLKATFTEQGQETLQRQLISELIDEIKKIDKNKFTVKTKGVKIVSAYPLVAGEKADLKKILSEKLGLAVELEETVNTDVIAGLIIQIGALTIDGSIRNKVKKVMPYIKG